MTAATAEQPVAARRIGFARPREIAEFLGVSLTHVYNLAERGELPAKRFGRTIRVSWDALYRMAETPAES